MKPKTWIVQCITSVILFFSAIALFNYYVDSYAIWKNDYTKLFQIPNQNYIKMKFLISKKHNFDSFIFGSSRVGHITLDNLKDGKWYNMTYSEGLPLEHLNNIELLLKKGIQIKNILLGLDDFSYEVDPLSHTTEPLVLSHYETNINKMTKIKFHLYYLLKKISSYDLSALYKKLTSTQYLNGLIFDIYKTGIPIVPKEVEENIEKNINQHINNKIFKIPTHYSGNRIDKTLATIKKIVTLSKKYNFKLTIFINPIHKTTYLDTNFKNFQKFKEGLAKITNYYDFSGLNKITTNNYYYYETSHYRNKVGEMIKNRLFHSKYDKDFGVYVTKDNIEQHLNNLKNQLQNYKKIN